MKIITLEKGLKIYNFDKEAHGEFVSYNIGVIEDGDDCLVIDTAFRRHFNLLLEDLSRNNKTITQAIITHFHRDHIGGVTKLRNTNIYASKNAEITIKKVFKDSDYSKYLPTNFVESEIIYFGNFKINMVMNIGHSVDGLLVIVNDKYLFVGDDMIYDLNGKELLPFPSEGDYLAHIESLNRIKEYSENGVIIPSHGPILDNKSYFIQDIENRIKYLEYKYKNTDKNHKDFYKETGISFLGHKWYKNNV